MASKPRNEWVDRLQYLVLRLVSSTLHCFPVDANLRTARLIGSALFRLDRKHRERALANLRRSFPDMPEPMRYDIARRSAQGMIMLFVEVLFTTRLLKLDTWTRYCTLRDFEPAVKYLLGGGQPTGTPPDADSADDGRGLIVLTGHYGNFEICGYLLALLGFPTSSVARPLDNRYVSRWLFGVREKMGQKIIAKKGATEEVTQTLDQGGAVAFVADQNAGSKGIFVDFFGRKASTYKSIGLLAMQYRVPIVVGYARRTGVRFHFDVGVQDIIRPADWADADNPLYYITQRYTAALEAVVRDDPSQYWWVHRRWKSRPKGETAEAYD